MFAALVSGGVTISHSIARRHPVASGHSIGRRCCSATLALGLRASSLANAANCRKGNERGCARTNGGRDGPGGHRDGPGGVTIFNSSSAEPPGTKTSQRRGGSGHRDGNGGANGRRRARDCHGEAPPSPCVSTAIAPKTLPLPCVSTADQQTVPLLCVHTVFVTSVFTAIDLTFRCHSAQKTGFALRVCCLRAYVSSFALRVHCRRS